jgi:hypothetical protein
MSGLQAAAASALVMEPEPGNPQEVEGVLNPAAAARPGWPVLYLFPRHGRDGVITRASALRACGSMRAGDPAGVERLGIALEPEA